MDIFIVSAAAAIYVLPRMMIPSSCLPTSSIIVARWIGAIMITGVWYYGTDQTCTATLFATLWSPLTMLVASQWPKLLPQAPAALRNGGPLGVGCAKLVEAVVVPIGLQVSALPVVAVLQKWQPALRLPNNVAMLFCIGGFCLVVNAVLRHWAGTHRGTQHHASSPAGVHAMVQSTLGRPLTIREHAKLTMLAFLNALCEEITSRGIWRGILAETMAKSRLLGRRQQHHVQHASNAAQAVIFGLLHYRGIPSGCTGVALTFVYGLCMGVLHDFYSLTAPVLAHTVADYYIFAIIARQKQGKKVK